MNVILQPILCMLLMFASRSDSLVFAANAASNSDGFGYEILVSKLEYLEHALIEQQLEIKQLMQDQSRSQALLQTYLENVIQRLGKMEGSMVPKLNQVSNKVSQLEVATSKELNKLSSQLKTIDESVSYNFNVMYDNLKPDSQKVKSLPVRSCLDEPRKKSGQYWLQPSIGDTPFAGFCEQQKFAGGWLTIQNRFDGSVDFFRSWADYRVGFGKISGEYWLGLESLHRLTRARNHSLVVEIVEFSGKYSYAMYDHFEVGSEAEQYSLKELGKYSGTAGDALSLHKGMGFTTKDRDNDDHDKNCATLANGGWWYTSCVVSNLNGKYGNQNSDQANCWIHLKKKCVGLAMTRMMIKPT